MYGYLHTNARLTKNSLNVVDEDTSRSHREHQRYPQVAYNLLVYPYNERFTVARLYRYPYLQTDTLRFTQCQARKI
jgi:hypothetical protein